MLKQTYLHRLPVLTLASVLCLSGCASHYFKQLQQQRLYYACEQIQQSIDEIQALNATAEANQMAMVEAFAVAEGWTPGDVEDTKAGVLRRSGYVEQYLLGLSRAKEQILAASEELAQQSEWVLYNGG